MKYIIMSDIHGNYEALKEVLDKITSEKLIVLGDIIGYGPNPNDCISELGKYNPIVIRGNHEDYLNKTQNDRFSDNARLSHEILDDLLEKEFKEKLKSLPLTVVTDDFLISHSSPFSPNSFYYLRKESLSAPQLITSFIVLKNMGLNLSFVGHTHKPGIFVEEKYSSINYIDIEFNLEYKIEENKKYIINCGSIGQPRNECCDAQYLEYDSLDKTVVFRKTKYDIDKTVSQMKRLNLPEFLYTRLLEGK